MVAGTDRPGGEPAAYTPSFRLDGQVALVTGVASGIGRGVALGLSGLGAAVGCLDLPGAGQAAVADEITAADGRAVAVSGDVSDPEQLADAVAGVEASLGPLQLAVNSAGVANAAPAEDMPLTQWQRLLEVNTTGVFLSCQAEARAMLRNGGGSIVNIASMSGTIVNRGLTQAHYNSSKAAVIQMTKSLAMEWSTQGLRVNSVSPGYTATPMNRRPEVADRAKRFADDTPLGRMAEVRELVGPVAFLLSDAASFCTGVDLVVDGGFTCW